MSYIICSVVKSNIGIIDSNSMPLKGGTTLEALAELEVRCNHDEKNPVTRHRFKQ